MEKTTTNYQCQREGVVVADFVPGVLEREQLRDARGRLLFSGPGASADWNAVPLIDGISAGLKKVELPAGCETMGGPLFEKHDRIFLFTPWLM